MVGIWLSGFVTTVLIGATAPDDSSIYTAPSEQLEILVIDRVDRTPTEN